MNNLPKYIKFVQNDGSAWLAEMKNNTGEYYRVPIIRYGTAKKYHLEFCCFESKELLDGEIKYEIGTKEEYENFKLSLIDKRKEELKIKFKELEVEMANLENFKY
jgi:hypothetical protein